MAVIQVPKISSASIITDTNADIYDPQTVINSHASKRIWCESSSNTIATTLVGQEVSTWKDINGGGNAFNTINATTRALLTSGLFGNSNQHPGAQFTFDRYGYSGSFDTEAAHSVVLILKWPPYAGLSVVLGKFASANDRHYIARTANNGQAGIFRGTTGCSVPIAANKPSIVIASYDGTMLKCRIDKTRATDVVAAGPGANGASLVLGAYSVTGSGSFAGAIRSIGLFQTDIFAAGNELLLLAVLTKAKKSFGISCK